MQRLRLGTATHCNTLQHTTTHYNTPPHIETHRNTPQHTTTHHNTLQHTATHLVMQRLRLGTQSAKGEELSVWTTTEEMARHFQQIVFGLRSRASPASSSNTTQTRTQTQTQTKEMAYSRQVVKMLPLERGVGGLSNSGEDLLRKIAAFFEQVTVRKVPDSDAKEKHTHAKENYTHANETCVGNASATPLTPSPSDVSVCDEGKEAGGREGVGDVCVCVCVCVCICE